MLYSNPRHILNRFSTNETSRCCLGLLQLLIAYCLGLLLLLLFRVWGLSIAIASFTRVPVPHECRFHPSVPISPKWCAGFTRVCRFLKSASSSRSGFVHCRGVNVAPVAVSSNVAARGLLQVFNFSISIQRGNTSLWK